MEELLTKGRVLLNCDARRAGVRVPTAYSHKHHLALLYGRGSDLAKPIVDLAVCSDGVHATLSFEAVNHPTFIPWISVFAMSKEGDEPTLWMEDLPAELGLASPPVVDAPVEPVSPCAECRPVMKRIKADVFWMGSADKPVDPKGGSQPTANERPRHQVSLGDFELAETEVTQAQYEAVMKSNPLRVQG